MIQFEVLGTPAPKGSRRAVKNKWTGKAMTIPGGSKQNEANLKSWDTAVREAARNAIGGATSPPFVLKPLVVTIVFRMARPSDHWSARGGLKPWAEDARPMFKPDGDKLLRATLDSLKGIIYDDDARIVAMQVHKVYANAGDEGAWISINLAQQNPQLELVRAGP
jgi:Holliday junction resolvase RusA-like endonuclease